MNTNQIIAWAANNGVEYSATHSSILFEFEEQTFYSQGIIPVRGL